jgi:alpha-1,2-mannosyltransferase
VIGLSVPVRTAAAPLVSRIARPRVALMLTVSAAIALTPVMEELYFGQVGLALMTMCLFDCVLEKPAWPRGFLIGIGTAVKLLPGIFIPYLWLTGRRRAAITATATAVALTLAGFAVVPDDSHTFWTSRAFDNSRVGASTYFSNQSLNGMLQRALGSQTRWLWIAFAAIVMVYGLGHAVRANRRGQELLGVSLTALVGILVSPVSWIHHLVWIVPVLAMLLDDGTNRRRVAITVSLSILFALHLPYLGEGLPQGWTCAWLAGPLKDSYGLACLALLFSLPRLVTLPRAPGGSPPSASAVPTSS